MTQIYESGVDAVAFTFPEQHEHKQFILHLVAGAIEVLKSEGNDLTNPAPHGFEGVACGGAFYGVRAGIYLVKLEGGFAHDITDALRLNSIGVKWTRADFQVTYSQSLPAHIYTARLRRHARRAIVQPGNPIPASGRIFESPDGADSYYLRNTRGTVVHRFYNKAAQSPDRYPPDAWRSEHQVRHDRAIALMQQAYQAPDLPQFALGVNVGHVLKYGIDEPWMHEAAPVRYSPKGGKSDTAKRLEWCIGSAVPCLLKIAQAGVNLEAVLKPLQDAGYVEFVQRRKIPLNPAADEPPLNMEDTLPLWEHSVT